MIREEYDYQDLKSFLDSQETVLIAGWPTQEERSFFFSDIWKSQNREVILLNKPNDQIGDMDVIYYSPDGTENKNVVNLRFRLLTWLKKLHLNSKVVILDLYSLDNV